MRVLFWFLFLAVAAVVVALAAKLNNGYALLVAPPYRVELSLNLFLLLIVAGFAALYLALRMIVHTARLPAEVRAWRRRQREARSRAKQEAATVALLEGRYVKAQQQAKEALAFPDASGLAALIGARAAIDVRQYAAAEELLGRPEAQGRSLAVSRLTLSAESALEQGQPQDALRILSDLKREAGLHTAALRLELRAAQASGRFSDISALTDQLVKRGVFDAAQAAEVKIAAQREQLRSLATDATGLREAWNRLPEAARTEPRIARAGARSFLALGADREAAEIAARGLERQWDSELVEIYGECVLSEATRQLEQAEAWLAAHNQDAALLRVLGTLCERAQLWGKAQTYFEASLAIDDRWETHLTLGEMLGRLGRNEEANAHFVAALKLATEALKRNP